MKAETLIGIIILIIIALVVTIIVTQNNVCFTYDCSYGEKCAKDCNYMQGTLYRCDSTNMYSTPICLCNINNSILSIW